MSKAEEFEALRAELDAQADAYDSLAETIEAPEYQRAQRRYHDFCLDKHARILRALRLLEAWEKRAEIEMPTDARICAALREVAP